MLALSSALAMAATSMIWHPNNPKNSMWDTWLFVQPNYSVTPFYLNYLSSCDSSCTS